MRDLAKVIEEMVEASTNEELNKLLNHVKTSVWYTAPESMYVRWDEVDEIISTYIPNPLKNEETIKVYSIFLSTTPEELMTRNV